MGQAASAERSLTETSHGTITFSSDVLKKVTEDVETQPEKRVEPKAAKFMTDREWTEKLKEMDEKHSIRSGLTMEAFNNIAERIEHKLNDIDVKVPYAHEILMDNLTSKKHTSMYSSPAVKNFIQCADIYHRKMLRRRLFEAKMEESRRRRNKRRFIY